MKIGRHEIGLNHPTYIIAEVSANHNQSYEEAEKLVHLAKSVGADAVKLQTYTADTITIDGQQEHFKIGKGTIWEGRGLYELYEEAHMPWDWQPMLMGVADEIGIDCFSSPFDFTAVDFLESLDVPAYKIASFELVDLPLIDRCARTGKPLIMSTGMAQLHEISEAVATARSAGCTELALLKCNSGYPAPASEMNLLTIPQLRNTFGVEVGLSDHTLGNAAAVVSVALGGRIIEKHFTASRAVPGPDSAFSLEPDEFRLMVENVREAEASLGVVSFQPSVREEASLKFRRSLILTENVRAGDLLTDANLRSVRPAVGLSPKYLPQILGSRILVDAIKGTPLQWEMVGPKED